MNHKERDHARLWLNDQLRTSNRVAPIEILDGLASFIDEADAKDDNVTISVPVTVVDEAGIPVVAEASRDAHGALYVRLAPGSFVAAKPIDGHEAMPDTVARLHAEVETLRPIPAQHEKLKHTIAAMALALDEAIEARTHEHDTDETKSLGFHHVDWFYKARAIAMSAGHKPRELWAGHVEQRRAEAEASGDHHLTLFWTALAKETPDAPAVSAIDHFVREICPRCSGFGGSPERIRRLIDEIQQRDRAIVGLLEKAANMRAADAKIAALARELAEAQAKTRDALAEVEAAHAEGERISAAASAQVEKLQAEIEGREEVETAKAEALRQLDARIDALEKSQAR